MNDVTLFEGGAGVPDHIKKDFGADAVEEFSSGVQSGFPVLSFRGKVWRVKKSGEERPYVDENGDPKPSMELVIVKGSKAVSKIFYPKGYEEGSSEAPDCFSMDGHRPDPNARDRQADLCSSCPHNEWGSKITPDGKKTKACADNRRIAVVSVHDLRTNGADATPLLLRIPGGSLVTLKEYAERTLGSRGFPTYGVVTRFGFDQMASYPKLTFRPVAALTEEEFNAAKSLRDGDDVARILSDHSDIVQSEPQEAVGGGEAQPAANAGPAVEPRASERNGGDNAEEDRPSAPERAEAPVAEAKPAQSPPPKQASKLDKVKSDVDALLGSL